MLKNLVFLWSLQIGKTTLESLDIHLILSSHNTHFPSNFTANRHSLEDNIDSGDESIHSSALLAFRFPVKLSGYNHFVGNLGGGITLLNARLTVRGKLLLLNNVAAFGGGIAMDDSCLVSESMLFTHAAESRVVRKT